RQHLSFLCRSASHQHIHSFPTRRSSDLDAIEGLVRCPGSYVADVGRIKPYVVFSAFHRAWLDAPRRETIDAPRELRGALKPTGVDRKSTRLNSSHDQISDAVFCLQKKND